MAMQNGNAHAADHGLRALALFLRLHGVNAEPDQLRDRCGSSTIGMRALLRGAREFGVKVRSRTTHWKRLASIQLPGIASLHDGGFLLLGKVDDHGAILLRCHGIAADPDQIRHRMGAKRLGVTEILRCAKEFGLKARAQRSSWDRLAVTPLPGIALLRDGGFLILGQVVDDKLMVQRPLSPQPDTMTQAELETIWDGDIILMTRRASLSDLSRRFDIGWFVGAVHKYRRLLGEVLVASFFLQF